MDTFAHLPAENLLRPEGFVCACGRRHIAGIRNLKIAHDAILAVPVIVRELGATYPLVVCGPNSYKAAGEAVCRGLKEAGIPYKLHVIPQKKDERILPNEVAVGSVVLGFDPACDLILGVGSGVINDVCKVVGRAVGRPNMIVGTAPSMDGYASSSSAMEVNNIKLSLPEQLPIAIVCDTGIMKEAPMRLLWAGLGDMMAKYTALCEWRIAHLVVDEYYCEETAKLVRNSLAKVSAGAERVAQRDEASITSIADGLILSGLGMAFANVSRPASGLEHYFSHCWEMMDIAKGRISDLHGIQVGIGTLLVLKIFRHLKTIRPSYERAVAAADAFDPVHWEATIRRVFSDTADGILEMEKVAQKNERTGRLRRARQIVDHWDSIMRILDEELPAYDTICSLMRHVGMPMFPKDNGLSTDEVINAFVCSRDIRDKYLTSSLIWDIGYMDEFAEWLRDELETI